MSRVLLIPAAGPGSRLGAAVPKVLVPVGGVAMLDRLRHLYEASVDRVVLVLHPSFAAAVRQHVAAWPLPVTCVIQERPSGMLDAILLAKDAVRAAARDEVWVTWCDQVAVHPITVRRLAETTSAHPEAALVMPTVQQPTPYIHLQRDATGAPTHVFHRREGDPMPEVGESDMGLFALSATTYLERLPAYASEAAVGRVTGERNFLPVIPWLATRYEVVTFPAFDAMEAVGVNTPAELVAVERYLAGRSA